jgi:hypothetical protein
MRTWTSNKPYYLFPALTYQELLDFYDLLSDFFEDINISNVLFEFLNFNWILKKWEEDRKKKNKRKAIEL